MDPCVQELYHACGQKKKSNMTTYGLQISDFDHKLVTMPGLYKKKTWMCRILVFI